MVFAVREIISVRKFIPQQVFCILCVFDLVYTYSIYKNLTNVIILILWAVRVVIAKYYINKWHIKLKLSFSVIVNATNLILMSWGEKSVCNGGALWMAKIQYVLFLYSSQRFAFARSNKILQIWLIWFLNIRSKYEEGAKEIRKEDKKNHR